MTKILLLSDTHGHTDERILHYAKNADEVWHAGDFGNSVAATLSEYAPLRGVWGNIDDALTRKEFPEFLSFRCEEKKILMTHIGGYPGKYSKAALEKIQEIQPDIFISGHSHILKVMYDKKYALLHLNPGACGHYGWHKMRTMLRFEICGSEIQNLEIIELEKK